MSRNIAILCSLLVLLSCTNPFATRDPEPPADNTSSAHFDQPFSPEVVLENLRYAIVEKNLTNYMRCFIDTSIVRNVNYHFIPEPSADAEKFISWGLMDEETYLRTVFFTAGQIQADQFGSVVFNTITSSIDSVQSDLFEYALQVSGGDSLEIYTGRMRLRLIKNDNALWGIYRWEDYPPESGGSATWSQMKARYR
jgi:hypothetical protein